jgi:hypothetical protein
MTDPAPAEPLQSWLVYVHPLWMLTALALCLVALRAGLALRRAQAARRPPPRGARALHLRVAKPGVALISIGFALGPLSVALLRDWTPMSSFHALLGGVAVVLFAGAALQGRRLESGDQGARRLHALLGGAAVALGLTAAVAGFVLVP